MTKINRAKETVLVRTIQIHMDEVFHGSTVQDVIDYLEGLREKIVPEGGTMGQFHCAYIEGGYDDTTVVEYEYRIMRWETDAERDKRVAKLERKLEAENKKKALSQRNSTQNKVKQLHKLAKTPEFRKQYPKLAAALKEYQGE